MHVVAIHQPNYIPWLGYFYKMSLVDTFVYLDNVQVSRGKSYVSRNRILSVSGSKPAWLTVPISGKGQMRQIKDVEITENNWQRKHFRTLQVNYGNQAGFQEYEDVLKSIYLDTCWDKICELNIRIMELIMFVLGINVKTVRASSLGLPELCGDEILISILKRLDTEIYVTGQGSGSTRYITEDLVKAECIELRYMEFKHPVYPQVAAPFVPNLSALDLVLTHGQKARSFLFG